MSSSLPAAPPEGGGPRGTPPELRVPRPNPRRPLWSSGTRHRSRAGLRPDDRGRAAPDSPETGPGAVAPGEARAEYGFARRTTSVPHRPTALARASPSLALATTRPAAIRGGRIRRSRETAARDVLRASPPGSSLRAPSPDRRA